MSSLPSRNICTQAVVGGAEKCRAIAQAMNIYIGVSDVEGLSCVEDDTVREKVHSLRCGWVNWDAVVANANCSFCG